MSVTTTCDEKIDLAKEKMGEAYNLLLEAMKDDTWGKDEYKSDYIDNVHLVISELIKLKRKI